MKFLIPVLVAAFVPMFGAQAEDNLEAKKAMITQNLDKRIGSLQKMKGCMQGAANQAGLEACHKTLRAEMEAHDDARTDARIQKLQERKEKRKKD